MLCSPSGFRRWVSQAIQEPPSEFLPAAPGIQRSASRRTPGLRVLLSIAEPHLGPITHTHHQTHQAVGCVPRTAGPKSPPAPSPLSPTADHATSGPPSNTSPPKGNASADPAGDA